MSGPLGHSSGGGGGGFFPIHPVASPPYPRPTEDRGKASSPSPDHVAAANEHVRMHRAAVSRMARSIRAAGDLFGRELAEHLTRRHEDLNENTGEAIYHLEQRIRYLEERESRGILKLGAEVQEQRAQVAQFHAFASRMARELERRAARSGKPVPDFVTEYRSWIFQTDGPF